DSYDPFTGRRLCHTAPGAIEYWGSGKWLRRPEDRTDLDAFLATHPGAVNGLYGAACETPLHTAAGRGREDVVPVLIARGADLRARDKQGTAALAYAVGTGNLNVVKLLLGRGADRTGSDTTDDVALGQALSSAAYAGHVEIAALLMDRGADVNWRYRGPLPLEWKSLPLAVALTVARSSAREPVMARRREVA